MSDEPQNPTQTQAASQAQLQPRTSTPTRTRTLMPDTPAPTRAEAPPQPSLPVWLTRLLIVGLVLAALNLRPAITSLGALLEEVREGLHMSGGVAGVLTSVPSLCFAVFGITAPRLARRFGPGAIVFAGMAAITAGLVIRPFTSGTAPFLAASALALMGIAVSNVLMPVIVKRYFPDRVGTMTGLYSMALALGTSLAAAATVPVTDALGGNWRTGLAVWAVLGALAVAAWLPLVRHPGHGARPAPGAEGAGATGADGTGARGVQGARPATGADGAGATGGTRAGGGAGGTGATGGTRAGGGAGGTGATGGPGGTGAATGGTRARDGVDGTGATGGTRAGGGVDGTGATGGPDGTGAATGGTRARGGVGGRGAPAGRITRSRTAWALGCFFGLQATGAYITMGWMPQIFRDAGVSAGTAGVLLAVTMVMGVPLAFVIPRLAGRMKNQGPIVVALGLCGLSGYAGLHFAPAAGAWAWALLLGVSNCAFPLALTMIGMRSRTSGGVVRLSAFAQSVGYLISIPGPTLIGALYEHTGGWETPLTLMAGLMVPQMIVGVIAGRDRTIEDEN